MKNIHSVSARTKWNTHCLFRPILTFNTEATPFLFFFVASVSQHRAFLSVIKIFYFCLCVTFWLFIASYVYHIFGNIYMIGHMLCEPVFVCIQHMPEWARWRDNWKMKKNQRISNEMSIENLRLNKMCLIFYCLGKLRSKHLRKFVLVSLKVCLNVQINLKWMKKKNRIPN